MSHHFQQLSVVFVSLKVWDDYLFSDLVVKALNEIINIQMANGPWYYYNLYVFRKIHDFGSFAKFLFMGQIHFYYQFN